jgi:hypothetical protein
MHLHSQVVPPAEIKPKRERVSDASRDAVIETLRHRLKELEGDNRELRKQIEVAYGHVQQAQVSRSKQQERDCLSFVDTRVT